MIQSCGIPKTCAVVVLLACLPVVSTTTPADAQPSAPDEPAITHPQDDYAGSQIAAHEGGRLTPQDMLATPAPAAPKANGLDVSHYQGTVNWAAAAKAHALFAYVKATEGTTYVNPSFSQQYQGAYHAGLSRGAYHFATPNTSDGAAQANYFVAHGGGWSKDGRTLPPAVDLEYNPYGQECYGMTPAALGTWVRAFVNQVHARTGRLPVIYTSTRWWSLCMGGNATFGGDPLWIARFNDVVGGLPPGWTSQTIWQFADSGTFPGDQDVFHGTAAQLKAFTTG